MAPRLQHEKANVDIEEMKVVEGKYDKIMDFAMDAKGYFLVRIDRKAGKIEAGFCPKKNKMTYKITGRTPQEVYFTAAKLGLFSNYDHAAYLGKELEKAYLSLKYGLDYIQDEDLCLPLRAQR